MELWICFCVSSLFFFIYPPFISRGLGILFPNVSLLAGFQTKQNKTKQNKYACQRK